MRNKLIIAIVVLGVTLSFGFGGQSVAYGSYRIVLVKAIGFLGGITIQDDGGIINAPQWEIWRQAFGPSKRSKPVAYIKNSNVQIWAKFLAEKSVTQVTIWAESDDVLGNLTPVIVDFVDGESPYYQFTPENPAPNYLSKDILEFQWKGTVDASEQNVGTSSHIMYTILDNPAAPMETPWVKLLDKACQWAQGISTEAEAAAKITEEQFIWLDATKVYDGTGSHAPGTTFYLNDFLDDSWGDCRDVSAYFHILCRAVGISNAQVRRISYISGSFCVKPILPFGYAFWWSGCWNFHQVGWYGNVYDTNILVDQSDPKYAVDMDINGDYKSYVYNSGTWNTSESPFGYTTIIGTSHVWGQKMGKSVGNLLLSQDEMGDYRLIEQRVAHFPVGENIIRDGIERKWKSPQGEELRYQIIEFDSNDEAREGAMYYASHMATPFTQGSFSGTPLGDTCWKAADSGRALLTVKDKFVIFVAKILYRDGDEEILEDITAKILSKIGDLKGNW
jgi:hypothetical protein